MQEGGECCGSECVRERREAASCARRAAVRQPALPFGLFPRSFTSSQPSCAEGRERAPSGVGTCGSSLWGGEGGAGAPLCRCLSLPVRAHAAGEGGDPAVWRTLGALVAGGWPRWGG